MDVPPPPPDAWSKDEAGRAEPSASEGATPGQRPARPDSRRPSPAEAFADRLDEGRFFPALFDFTFTRFATRRLAGPLYAVGLAVILLGVVYGFIISFAAAVATGVSWGVLLFLFGVILTVVAAMLAILLLRVGIEMVVAIVAIAQQTRARAGLSRRGQRREGH
ncbi:MAG TPA: DUF4282 domain-containing protein [Microbacteriaceae bacterium]|nr:DUF4282 domain-containing protein [Microbacteriaceae bacterium]